MFIFDAGAFYVKPKEQQLSYEEKAWLKECTSQLAGILVSIQPILVGWYWRSNHIKLNIVIPIGLHNHKTL
jgi:hypothetical protein